MKGLVIIPTYNELENVPLIVPEILKQDKELDVLIVDDGSPDGTGAKVKEMMTKNKRLHILEREKKSGLGRAYIAGFRWSLENGYDYVIEMDADFSHDPNELHLLIEAMRNGRDAVFGSRYIGGVRVLNWDMKRLILSAMGNSYARFATGVKLTDLTGGYNLYTRKVLEGLNLDRITSNGYSFQIEMKSKSVFKKFSVEEVPIIFRDRSHGSTKMSGGIVNEALFKCWRIRFDKWFKKY
ncbi:MAG: dolichyl-phosphate beta-D-mannosyltransferase [Spirochaetes bacterium GWF1_51_8]|nr:MAG: dolichyl-phosphate beta-D-mannosyltransferase [Spirochaetes bacterium GWF1_51_8]